MPVANHESVKGRWDLITSPPCDAVALGRQLIALARANNRILSVADSRESLNSSS